MKPVSPSADAPSPLRRMDELAALYQLTDSLYRARTRVEIFDAGLNAITTALGNRASILLFDEKGVMQFVAWRGLSEHYRTRLAGHSPWKPGDRDPEPLLIGDIDRTDEADWVKETIRAEGIRALAFIPLLIEGAVIGKFMAYYPEVHEFDRHEINLAVSIARQLGFSLQRARAEEARQSAVEELRESEARFRLLSEQAPVMIWTSDASGHCLHLNRMLRTFWGVDEKDVPDFDWGTTIHPGDIQRIGAAMGAATQRHEPVVVEGRYRRIDGEYRALQTSARPRFAPGGEFLGMIGVNVDISEMKRAEAQRELLVAELNHRVKNTLAVVQSIAHQTFRADNATPEARRAFEGRLVALANAHNLLTQANWENASLHTLAADAVRTQGVAKGRILMDGPEVHLPARHAVAIALALHELCTNAVKYGSLSTDAGRIRLEWRREGGAQPQLRLTWREFDGPPVAPPSRRGFGSRLIEDALARDLDGEVTMQFNSEGLVCAISAPLSGASLQ